MLLIHKIRVEFLIRMSIIILLIIPPKLLNLYCFCKIQILKSARYSTPGDLAGLTNTLLFAEDVSVFFLARTDLQWSGEASSAMIIDFICCRYLALVNLIPTIQCLR